MAGLGRKKLARRANKNGHFHLLILMMLFYLSSWRHSAMANFHNSSAADACRAESRNNRDALAGGGSMGRLPPGGINIKALGCCPVPIALFKRERIVQERAAKSDIAHSISKYERPGFWRLCNPANPLTGRSISSSKSDECNNNPAPASMRFWSDHHTNTFISLKLCQADSLTV